MGGVDLERLSGMTEALQITYHGTDRQASIDRLIGEQADKLFQLFEKISSCRVVVETPHRSHTKGNHFVVGIELHVPGDVLFIKPDHAEDAVHEDLASAIRNAFQIAVRKLRHYVQRLRA